jgi:hypothetical protein
MLITILQKRPEVGLLTSLMSSLLDHKDFFQLIGIIIGLLIGIVTLILKIIELKEKLSKRKKG